ncbi:uncharacterized protein NKAIN [Planococcus citri]|uniref:uncharacterized protein NKAIN n=1 Tax=Planococcus citri TaxID=170843 RepID=UPI0031FA031C
MELCTSRHLLLSVFILQLIMVSVRQTFDFLGYMWASVLMNFLYTLVIIFGTFGVVQSKTKYTITYTVSSTFWIFWNLFIMCVYFEILNMQKMRTILSFGTDSNSWWETNGPGCKPVFNSNREVDEYRPAKPDQIKDCIVDFHYVEAIQAIIHVILALWGCGIGAKVSHDFVTQTSSKSNNKKQNGVLPLYSIEYSLRRPEEMFDDDDSNHSHDDSDNRGTATSGSRPMTPRRVKRRSVNSRGTLPPQYQQRQEQQPPPYIRRPTYGSTRSSARSSARRHRASTHNPVSRFLEQQQQLSFHHQMLNDSSTSNDSCRVPPFTSSQSQLLSAAELQNTAAEMGHVNPNFASNTSLDRPPSARSSYSNYHGVRTLAFNKQATPQVPSNSCRRGTRSAYSTFFNDGPPAYEIQGVVNSETVI